MTSRYETMWQVQWSKKFKTTSLSSLALNIARCYNFKAVLDIKIEISGPEINTFHSKIDTETSA